MVSPTETQFQAAIPPDGNQSIEIVVPVQYKISFFQVIKIAGIQ
jgi:hypothetical protein